MEPERATGSNRQEEYTGGSGGVPPGFRSEHNEQGIDPILCFLLYRILPTLTPADIDRAKESCSHSDNKADHHFAGAGKMVGLGSRGGG